MAKFYLPDDHDRLVILGHTGSGKSQAGIWHLSRRSFDEMPWIIFDPKHDDLIARLKKFDFVQEIRLDKPPPTKAGLYVTHYFNDAITELLIERFLHKVMDNGNTGLYFDEGFSIPQRHPKFTGITRIQTQGRSRKVPVITLSQRPCLMSRFVWSEAGYFQYFGLTDDDDRKTVKRFARIPVEQFPPKYHSWWWNVAKQQSTPLQPVPDADTILEQFRDRAGSKIRRFL